MEEIMHQLIYSKYPMIYEGGFIAPSKRGLALGFLNHQP